ncbi:MAG: hypothetical protein IT285_13640 [Bdellovibrionales bacterium]|nr:hypothetical protein [Bdellovibrionales bacterium]
MNKSKVRDEFREFMSAEERTPPPGVTETILSRVRADLNPSAARVFSKLLAIHSVTAAVTLSFCPQFGFRLLGEGMGLMHVFMAFGTYGCMVACGALFTGLSLLLAAFILRGEEIRKIRDNRLLTLGALTLLSLGFFIMVDAEIVFSLAVTWFAGALIGSWLTLELGWMIRFRQAHQPT